MTKKHNAGDRAKAAGAGRPGAVWTLPALLYFFIFALVPLLVAVYFSFCKYNGIALNTPEFVGLANWNRLFHDPQILKSLWVTFALIIMALVTQVPCAILTGVWMAGPQRNRAITGALWFIPLLMSTAAVSVLWSSLINPNFGVPAALEPIIGKDTWVSNILGNPNSALGLIGFIYLWAATPMHTLLYQGAARAIPESLYQAAAIDGCGRVRQFFYITLPQLKNTFITSTIIMVVGTFTNFDLILILTKGGPSGGTSNLPFMMYDRGISALDYGYGCAIAVLLIVLAGGVSWIMSKASGYDKMEGTQEGIG